MSNQSKSSSLGYDIDDKGVQEQVLVTFGPVLIQFVVCVFAGGLDLGQNHCRVWRLMRLSNGGGKLL